jgi:hypothetical protein
MKRVGLFMAGFASGWVVRSTVDSSRGVAVGLIAAAYGAVDRAKRFVAIEREHLEDLWAEGKAQYEVKRARAAARGQKEQSSAGPRKAEAHVERAHAHERGRAA